MKFFKFIISLSLALPMQFAFADDEAAAKLKLDPARMIANVGDFHTLVKLMRSTADKEDQAFLDELLTGANFKLPKMQFTEKEVTVAGVKNPIDFSQMAAKGTLKVAGHKFIYDRGQNLQKNLERFEKFLEDIDGKAARNGFHLFREAWADDRADTLREAGMADPKEESLLMKEKVHSTSHTLAYCALAGAVIGAMAKGAIAGGVAFSLPGAIAGLVIGAAIGLALFSSTASAAELPAQKNAEVVAQKAPEKATPIVSCPDPVKNGNRLSRTVLDENGNEIGQYVVQYRGSGAAAIPMTFSYKERGHEMVRAGINSKFAVNNIEYQAAGLGSLAGASRNAAATSHKTTVTSGDLQAQANVSELANRMCHHAGLTIEQLNQIIGPALSRHLTKTAAEAAKGDAATQAK